MSVILKLTLNILELQMKSKKVKYLRGRFAFSNSLKGAILKKSLETLSYTDDRYYEYKKTKLFQYNKLLKLTT